jgi:hypothetical protein
MHGSTPIRQMLSGDISDMQDIQAPPPFPPCQGTSGRTSIFALFGGQGINEIYTLFDTYHPLVEPFLTSIINKVLQPLASASQGISAHEHGLNAISWLTGVVSPT